MGILKTDAERLDWLQSSRHGIWIQEFDPIEPGKRFPVPHFNCPDGKPSASIREAIDSAIEADDRHKVSDPAWWQWVELRRRQNFARATESETANDKPNKP